MTADGAGGLVIGLVVAACLLLSVGTVTWWLWRSTKRRVARWRGLWRRGTLRLRAAGSPWSARGELAQLHWELLENLERTERLFADGAIATALPRSLPALLPQLRRLATDLDGQLSLWEAEPDPTLVRRALPVLRDRVGAVVSSATRMRATALDLVDEAGRLGREAAETDLRRGLGGLEDGLEAIRQLHAPAFGSGPSVPSPVDPVTPFRAGDRRR